MSRKPAFTEWLLRQAHRNDPIGDLAYDAKDDSTWPSADLHTDYRDYLSNQGVSTACLDALRAAWTEWAAVAPEEGE